MLSRLTLSSYVNNKYKLCQTPLTFKSQKRILKNFLKSNNEKLYNNIIRAKSNIFDYCMCNEFYYFVTITVNSEHDRKDLDWLRKTTNQIIRDCRHKYGGYFKFILIPEQHKDGAWHMHGLFDKSFGQDFYINDKNYLSWSSYDKIGFSSISKIQNYDACIKYITKYIKKDFEKREKGKHLYFCSNNLKKSNKVLDLVISEHAIDFDFVGKFAKKSILNTEQVQDLIDYLRQNVYSILQDDDNLL